MRCHFLKSIPGGGLENTGTNVHTEASTFLLDAAASTAVSKLTESVVLRLKTFLT